jgi:hypothetical protein
MDLIKENQLEIIDRITSEVIKPAHLLGTVRARKNVGELHKHEWMGDNNGDAVGTAWHNGLSVGALGRGSQEKSIGIG